MLVRGTQDTHVYSLSTRADVRILASANLSCVLAEPGAVSKFELKSYCKDEVLLDFELGHDVALVWMTQVTHGVVPEISRTYIVDRVEKVCSIDVSKAVAYMKLMIELSHRPRADVDPARVMGLTSPNVLKQPRSINKWPSDADASSK